MGTLGDLRKVNCDYPDIWGVPMTMMSNISACAKEDESSATLPAQRLLGVPLFYCCHLVLQIPIILDQTLYDVKITCVDEERLYT